MDIEYRVNAAVTTDEFIELLHASTLAARRPVQDRACMEGMVRHANLLVTAWAGSQLVGISRALTDFHYACYIADLAVHRDFQRQGIGTRLQTITQEQLGVHCKLIVIAAPAAHSYYQQLGFEHHPRCWILDRDRSPGA